MQQHARLRALRNSIHIEYTVHQSTPYTRIYALNHTLLQNQHNVDKGSPVEVLLLAARYDSAV